MLDYDGALVRLRADLESLQDLTRQKINIMNSTMSAAEKDERERDIESAMGKRNDWMRRTLRTMVDFPPHHVRHQQFLEPFYQVAPYDRSVFVMTKFHDPDSQDPRDLELGALIQTVRDAVQASGFVSRVANDRDYHASLWDNVELHLLGCHRAIAIVEDKYLPEMNPNVAMEWGWMRGMGRNVLYLVESTFTRKRADWNGLLEKPFDWANPVPGIQTAVGNWLKS